MTPFSVTFGNVLLMLLYLLPGFFMCKVKKIKPDHLSSVSVILLYICGFGLYVNALSYLDPSPELFAKMGLFLLIALAGETVPADRPGRGNGAHAPDPAGAWQGEKEGIRPAYAVHCHRHG